MPLAAIVIEIPEDCKLLADAVREAVGVVERTRRASVGGKQVDYESVEGAVQEAAAKVERACHHAALTGLDIDREAIEVEGKRHARVGRYAATYYSLAGPVVVERSLYRPEGERNGKTVDTISLRAGAVGPGWLPRTARTIPRPGGRPPRSWCANRAAAPPLAGSSPPHARSHTAPGGPSPGRSGEATPD